MTSHSVQYTKKAPPEKPVAANVGILEIQWKCSISILVFYSRQTVLKLSISSDFLEVLSKALTLCYAIIHIVGTTFKGRRFVVNISEWNAENWMSFWWLTTDETVQYVLDQFSPFYRLWSVWKIFRKNVQIFNRLFRLLTNEVFKWLFASICVLPTWEKNI